MTSGQFAGWKIVLNPFGNAAGGGRFKIKNISQNTSFYQSQLFKMDLAFKF
jgi:hypothetical protein